MDEKLKSITDVIKSNPFIEMERLKKENEKLRKLLRYVKHDKICFSVNNYRPKSDQCTCGLERLIRELRNED